MASSKRSNTVSKSKETVRVLIVDDHHLVRSGIAVMLNSLPKQTGFVIEDAEDGQEAIKKAAHYDFDIILLDYNLSDMNGADVAKEILLNKPSVKILALSNFAEISYVESMIRAGAKGYILKNIEPSQLLIAMKTVLADGMYYSNEIAIKLLNASEKSALQIKKRKNLVTKREMEVLTHICMEKTNEQIAEELFVSKRTIDSHRQNLLMKLGARNTAGLIQAAVRLKLIEP